ncbi:MAG: hypothetical protein IJ347_03695 [Faecalibacterium sp.]|nr:hypothetical protein [Faecalibacterium sp.]
MKFKLKPVLRALRVLLFAVLLMAALRYTGNFLCGSSENPLNRAGEGLYYQLPGTVDVVYVGPSHVYSSIMPQLIFDQYGITGYNFSTAAQSFEGTYWALEEVIRLQHPKVAVVELVGATADPTVRQAPIYYTGLCRLLSPFSPVKYRAVNALMTDEKNSLAIRQSDGEGAAAPLDWTDFWRLTSFHAQYETISAQNFRDLAGPALYAESKGYSPNYAVFDPASLPQQSYTARQLQEVALSDWSLNILRRMVQLARRTNTRLVFMVAPYFTDAREQLLYAQLADWARQQGVELIDYNKQKESLGLNDAADYSDMSHLNDAGARKVSMAMGQYLADTGLFADKRQNGLYRGWQSDSGNYDLWAQVGALYQNDSAADAAQTLAALNEDYVAVLAGTPDTQLAEVLQAAGFDAQQGVSLCAVFDGSSWQLQTGADRLERNVGGRKLVALASGEGGYTVVDQTSQYVERGVAVCVYSTLNGEQAYAGVLSGLTAQTK